MVFLKMSDDIAGKALLGDLTGESIRRALSHGSRGATGKLALHPDKSFLKIVFSLVLVCSLLIDSNHFIVAAQQIEAINGSLIWSIAGARMTLSPDTPGATGAAGGGATTFVSQGALDMAVGFIQNQLTQLQTTNTQLQTANTNLAVGLAQTQTTLNQPVMLLAQTQNANNALMDRLNAITSCGNAGLFANAQGACIPTNRSISDSSSSSIAASSCPLNTSGSAAVAHCPPGFSPALSSTPTCAGLTGSQAFPTTFQWQGNCLS